LNSFHLPVGIWRRKYKENRKVIGNLTVGKVPPHVLEHPEVHGKKGAALSYSMSREYQRRGLMHEAVSAVIGRLFQEGVEYINGGYFDFNVASEKLHEKLGFNYMDMKRFCLG